MNEQIRYYKLRAKEYEAVYEKPERQKDLGQIRQYLSQQFPRKRILEIASGTGYWTQILSSSAQKILATDINPEVLSIARQKDYPQQNVKFQIQDLYRMPLPKTPYEGLFGGFILSHIARDDWESFFTNCLSQLSQGASLIFLDNRYVKDSSTPISRRDKKGNTFQSRSLASGEVFEVMKNFPTESELKQVLFSEISEWHWIECDYYWLLKCSKNTF